MATHQISLDANSVPVNLADRMLGRIRNIHYVMTPAQLEPEGVPTGTKLNVLRSFVSDERCPLGAGKKCLELERGYRAVFTGDKRGIAWLRNDAEQTPAPATKIPVKRPAAEPFPRLTLVHADYKGEI